MMLSKINKIEITNKKIAHVKPCCNGFVTNLSFHKTQTTIMLLGSNEYDNHSDESTDDDFAQSFDYDQKPKSKRKKSRTNNNGEMIRREAVAICKKEGEKKRKAKEKSEKKRKQDAVFNSPVAKITNYTHGSSTSTVASSASDSTNVSTTATLCGYHINPIESPDNIDNGVFTLKEEPVSDHVCRGCNQTASHCPNKVYHDICLHAVLDYYDKVGIFFTDEGIKEAYCNAYRVSARRDLCQKTTYYELSHNLHLPRCMEVGSLRQGIGMLKGHRLYTMLMKQRVHNVSEQIQKADKSIKAKIDELFNDDDEAC